MVVDGGWGRAGARPVSGARSKAAAAGQARRRRQQQQQQPQTIETRQAGVRASRRAATAGDQQQRSDEGSIGGEAKSERPRHQSGKIKGLGCRRTVRRQEQRKRTVSMPSSVFHHLFLSGDVRECA